MSVSQSNDLRKSVFSGFVWKFMERILAQLVSLVVSIVLARLLSPDDYSIVGIVTIFFAVCNVLISGGFNTALIQKKDADIKDYSTVLHMSMILATVLYIVMFFAAPWIAKIYSKDLLVPIIRVMSLTFFINAFNSVLSAHTSSHLQFRLFFFSTIAGTVVSAVVGILLAVKGFGAWALVAQQMSNAFIGTIVLCAMTKIKFVLKISFDRLKGLFSYGSKIFIASIITIVYDQINPLIIGLKFTSTDLAYYSKGQSFPGLLNSTINDTLAAVLFPAMAKLQDEKEAVLQVTRRYIRVASYVIFPIMMGFFAVADKFVTVLLTEKWLPAVPYIQIFCISYMFNIIQTGNLQAIKAIGRSDVSLILEIIKKSVYFIIVAVFIFFSDSPVMLAVSSIVCTLVATLVNTFPNRKLIGYRYRYQVMDLLPNFIIAIIMGGIIQLMGKLELPAFGLLVLQIIAGILLYILLSVLTRNDNFNYLLIQIKALLRRK